MGGDTKLSQLTMAMFYKDTPEKMDAVNPVADDADANMGFKSSLCIHKTKSHDRYDRSYPQRYILLRPFDFKRS